MKFLIGFYTQGLKFSGRTLKERALGGSETALLMMAKEMAARGHDVKVWCNCDAPGLYDGVYYHHFDNFDKIRTVAEFDVFFVYRFYDQLVTRFRSELNILVNHDVLVNVAHFASHLWQTDHIFCLSRFHKELFTKEFPEIDPHIWVTSNGLDMDMVDQVWQEFDEGKIKKNEDRFIYSSRPERGLQQLLENIWPQILKRNPRAELMLCGYDIRGLPIPEHLTQFYDYINQLINQTPNVVNLGQLKQDDYLRWLASSKLMIYPSKFPEIQCISAISAQVMGTPIICTDNFALPETVPFHECRVKGDLETEKYQKDFTNRVFEFVENKQLYDRIAKEGIDFVKKNYSWKDRAEEWENKIIELFTRRANKNWSKIWQNLSYYSDHVTAHYLAKREDLPELPISQEIMDNVGIDKEQYFNENTALWANDKWKINARFRAVAEFIADERRLKGNNKLRVLDVGCGAGGIATTVMLKNPEVDYTGIDFTEGVLQVAKEFCNEQLDRNISKPTFIHSDLEDYHKDFKGDKYDVVVAGEFLEHVVDYKKYIDMMEDLCVEDGLIIFTIPSGPMEWQSYEKQGKSRYHIHHYKFNNLKEIFGKKKDFELQHSPLAINPRGDLIAAWLIRYHKDKSRETGEYDVDKKILITRPYKSVSACMIAKNEEDNIGRCIKSFRDVVDEIIVVSCNSSDRTVEIAKELGAIVYEETDDPDGDGLFNFGWARNKSIEKATGDFILWIDADELLVRPHNLRKYVGTEIFECFIIRQQHLSIDLKDVTPDVPARLFRNFKGYKFYGCVSGDTCIDMPRDLSKYPNGIPIKDLVNNYKDEYCYSYNRKLNKFQLKPILDVQCIGRNVDVYKMTYKDGYTGKVDSLKITGNHPVMLFNNIYKNVSDLKVGDSLLPFRRMLEKKYWLINNVDCSDKILRKNNRVSEHRYILEVMNGKFDGDGHHKDKNTFNNSINNLELMKSKDHVSLHHLGKFVSERTKKLISKNHYDVSGKNNPNFGRHHSEETKKKIGQKSREKWSKEQWKLLAQIRNDKRNNKDVSELVKKWEELKIQRRSDLERFRSNHIITKIEKIGKTDVYNMEVQDNHNYVANGIVVHNCIHEHVENGMDTPIWPALMLPDVDIAHFGYIIEEQRRAKCAFRNLRLLKKDRQLHPQRQLGKVLMQRDYINLTNWEIEALEGKLGADGERYLKSVYRIYKEAGFDNPENIYHKLSTVVTQQALERLGRFGIPMEETNMPPFQVAFTLAGGIGGLDAKGEYKPQTLWFVTEKEFREFISMNVDRFVEMTRIS